MIVISKNNFFACFDIFECFRNKIRITKKHEKTKKLQKQIGILLTDDKLLLLRITLKVHFQDDSKQYQPLFENKADQRSVIKTISTFIRE